MLTNIMINRSYSIGSTSQLRSISNERRGKKIWWQSEKRGAQLISSSLVYAKKGIDHLCVAATLGQPKMWQSNLQSCCIAVSLESPRCDRFASVSSPQIATQDKHDIASWQVCSGGNTKLMCLCMMAFKGFNTAPSRYCTLNWCCAMLVQLICQMVMLKRDVILCLIAITNGLWLVILLCYDRCLGTSALFVACTSNVKSLSPPRYNQNWNDVIQLQSFVYFGVIDIMEGMALCTGAIPNRSMSTLNQMKCCTLALCTHQHDVM